MIRGEIMAEHSFQEVMKQWNRMCCAMHNCEDCEIYKKCLRQYCLRHVFGLNFDCNAIKAIELIVIQWAKDNPEKIYPTWGEWFLQTCQVPLTSDLKHNDWETTLNSHIPVDIAQKLGVKPKEG